MDVARPIPGWTPSTPEVRGDDLDQLARRHPAVVVHFWAPWNGVDPLTDRSIQAAAGRLAERVRFASCNIDLAENADLWHRYGLANVPSLLVLVGGRPRRLIVGHRSPDERVAEIETRLGDPAARKPWWAFWK